MAFSSARASDGPGEGCLRPSPREEVTSVVAPWTVGSDRAAARMSWYEWTTSSRVFMRNGPLGVRADHA